MRTVVIALGSAGDVHPFLAIGLALQKRGHHVAFLTNSYFESIVRRAGLDFYSVGSVTDYERATQDPNLWDPRRGLEVCWRHVFGPAMRPTYDLIKTTHAFEKCIVVAPPFAFGARLAQEAIGVPLVTVHLQPAILRTCHGGLEAGGIRIPAWLPMRCKAWLWKTIDWLFLDPLFCPELNALRGELGLKPVKNILGRWVHSPDRCIALFPDWFAPAQPDWPPRLAITGFPLFDEASIREPSLEVETFLAQGERPIVFTPGSAMRHAKRFFQVSLEACRILNRRAIFLSQHADQIPSDLPPTVRHFGYIPFSRLLNRVEALVHHGGIGTCAQAMKAGVPQLVVPMAHDQFDNASRMEMLGLGYCLRRTRYVKSVVAEKLAQLIKTNRVKARCRELAGRFPAQHALSDICALIEDAAYSFARFTI
jgi:UDP:flavonoid glycosyltransferase YjiC (YdhE family)